MEKDFVAPAPPDPRNHPHKRRIRPAPYARNPPQERARDGRNSRPGGLGHQPFGKLPPINPTRWTKLSAICHRCSAEDVASGRSARSVQTSQAHRRRPIAERGTENLSRITCAIGGPTGGLLPREMMSPIPLADVQAGRMLAGRIHHEDSLGRPTCGRAPGLAGEPPRHRRV